jgi:hypothetical protein
LPEDDWLGFTHAYFPASAFDETSFQQKWAFARKGSAYLALYAARGLEWIERGPTAFRELRSHGKDNAWVCQMGQDLLDGSFEDFQHKVLALDLSYDGGELRLTSLRGELISFGWDSPLVVNDETQALDGFLHFDNAYSQSELGADSIDIVYQGEGVRLLF